MAYSQYVKFQAEKDGIYHAVRNAFEANDGMQSHRLNVFIVGSPDSGKTQSYIFPKILVIMSQSIIFDASAFFVYYK